MDIRYKNLNDEALKELNNIKIHLRIFYNETIRDVENKKIGNKSYEVYKTSIGNINSIEWYKMAKALVVKNDEANALEDLINFTRCELAWHKNSKEQQLLEYALELYVSRIHEEKERVII